jgi:hypothetical protein
VSTEPRRILVWEITLTIASEDGQQIPQAARRLREVADAIENLPPNLVVGAGYVPHAWPPGWRAEWSVHEADGLSLSSRPCTCNQIAHADGCPARATPPSAAGRFRGA